MLRCQMMRQLSNPYYINTVSTHWHIQKIKKPRSSRLFYKGNTVFTVAQKALYLQTSAAVFLSSFLLFGRNPQDEYRF